MAAGLGSALSAALVAFTSIPLNSMAERQAMELEGGRMAVVVHHRRLQHAAAAPTAEGRGRNETLGEEVERLNRTMLERQNKTAQERQHAVRTLSAICRRLGPGEARTALLPAVPGLELAVAEDADNLVRTLAIRALQRIVQKAGPDVAERAVPVVLRAVTKDKCRRVRKSAMNILSFLRPEAAERAVPVAVVLQAATEDEDLHVRVAAMAVLPTLGPEAAERAVPVVLRAATEDSDSHVRAAAVAALQGLRATEAVERAVLGLLKEIGVSGIGDVEFRRICNDLNTLATFFWTLDPAAVERSVPTLLLALSTVLPIMDRRDTFSSEHRAPEELVLKIGVTLAKVPIVAGPDALYFLTQADKMAHAEDSVAQQIRMNREIVQGALQARCASSFLNESGAVYRVDNLTVEIPFGVMLVSDANGIHAHRCPNPYSCSMTRRQAMRPAEANHSSRPRGGMCPLLLAAPQEATAKESPACATGFDPASPGCARCIPGFGRKNSDPFSCEPCDNLGSAQKWAGWLAQPLLLFLLALRSAENAAVSKGMAEAVANDVVKIVLAYLSSISVVVSSVTSAAAYSELDDVDPARGMLNLTEHTVQLGDVTYSSSSDCLILNGKGAASVNELLALSLQLPACVLTIVALLLGVRACWRAALSGGISGLEGLQAEVMNTFVTCSLVAGNQFLPGVASACVRALPCFHTQAAVDGKGLLQFMTYDPNTKCRENTQHLWTCGLALMVVFAAGPVYWLALLHRQRGAQQAGPTRFLTGSYRVGFQWWESGRLIKTMLIACVVSASPTSYCPLQQLMLCLLVTAAFGFWHCRHFPYKYFVLNAAEAGALFTLIVGMVLSELLAGGGWSLDPGFRSGLVMSTAIVIVLYLFGLACLWLRVKLFWAEAADEEVPADASAQRESGGAA